MSHNRDAVLSQVVTAEQAQAWIIETVVKGETVHTEEQNESLTLADYLADVETVLARILEGDGYDELVTVERAVAASVANPDVAAMDTLARVWNSDETADGWNGGDCVELVGELLEATGRI